MTAAALREAAAEMDRSPEWENEPRDGMREMAWLDLMIEAQMVEEEAAAATLKAPFPWFGGKSRTLALRDRQIRRKSNAAALV